MSIIYWAPTEIADFQWLNPFLGQDNLLTSFNLTIDAHNDLLSLYFTYLNGWSGFVDEEAFRLGMQLSVGPTTPPPDGYSVFLHLCILSTASHISPYREQYGATFTQAAYSLLSSEISRPKPTTVIALTLLSTEATEAGRNASAWILSGKIS